MSRYILIYLYLNISLIKINKNIKSKLTTAQYKNKHAGRDQHDLYV